MFGGAFTGDMLEWEWGEEMTKKRSHWQVRICLCSIFLGVVSETLTSVHPPISDCLKWDSVGICAQQDREAIIPPHIHATSSG